MTANEMLKASNDETRRLSALLMGFAGAAIAFALHEADKWPATLALALVACSVCLWSISFAAGIFWAHAANHATILNAALFEARAHSPDRIPDVDRKMSIVQRRTARRYKCQLYALGFGALIYAAGFTFHVTEQFGQASIPAEAPPIAQPGH